MQVFTATVLILFSYRTTSQRILYQDLTLLLFHTQVLNTKCRAILRAHMVYGLKHQHFTSHSITTTHS